jgi:hypothetical protein
VIKNGYATLAGNDFTHNTAAAMACFAADLHQLTPTRWLASRPIGTAEEYCARVDRLAQLLVDARCDSSSVSHYFALLGRHFRQNRHDKVLAALLALREVMLASAHDAELGRGILIAGVVLVALVNLAAFDGAAAASHEQRLEMYARIYRLALGVPLISVLGVLLASVMRNEEFTGESMTAPPRVDRRILVGGAAFAVVSGGLGISGMPHADVLVFLLSFGIVLIVMRELLSKLDIAARRTLLGTATALFVFRALPDPGPGPTWWMIDQLGTDEAFLARLSALGSVLAIGGLFAFRRWMAQRSVAFTIVTLSLAWTVIALPTAGMYYGLHLWIAAHTGGAIDGRTIVITDTALLSLLSEIAMVPMLAWVARTAPDDLKATYFAVMISFTNLGFLVSRLGTEYLNGVFIVTRETRDAATGAIITAADYSRLGPLYITPMIIALAAPLLTIALLRQTRFHTC